jgi:acyl-[acyl-carrier-protein]-phospholipid O-acyltransferase/long-chain-fatty-acid--[acyl-carrier-protein] ligase
MFMFKSLMTTRRFAPLFWCQFCSALNDNFLKNALAMLILFGIAGSGQAAGRQRRGADHAVRASSSSPRSSSSPALGGDLADRFDKAWVAERVKLAEIPVAGLAAIGFFLHSCRS